MEPAPCLQDIAPTSILYRISFRHELKYLRLCELLSAEWVVLPLTRQAGALLTAEILPLLRIAGVVVGRDALWACRTLIAREQNCTVAKILGYSCRGTAVCFRRRLAIAKRGNFALFYASLRLSAVICIT